MLASELTLFGLVSFLFLIVGSMVGWLAKSHSYETQPRQIFVHPEMFDENGHLIPDEVLAIRFENDSIIEDEDEED
jgi:hypothetical protein